MDKQKLLFGTLFSTSNKLQTFGDSFLEKLSAKQWFLLAAIQSCEPEIPTLTRLVPIVGSSRQNIKQLALKLKKIGFLNIEDDLVDTRAVRLSLTEQCRVYWKNREDKDASFLNDLFCGLSDEEIDSSIKTLNKLEINIIALQKKQSSKEIRSST